MNITTHKNAIKNRKIYILINESYYEIIYDINKIIKPMVSHIIQ